MKHVFLSLLVVAGGLATVAQVQIDQAIELTGSGSQARISGLQVVQEANDAVHAELIQSGSLLSGLATGTGNAFSLTLSPPIQAYTMGMTIRFKSNQNISGPATINIDGLGAVPILKYVDQPLNACDIREGQMVEVTFDGDFFQFMSPMPDIPSAQAGFDQECLLTSSTLLSANSPYPSTGTWTIASGSGGAIGQSNSATTTFTGQAGESYLLAWTISNGCFSSSDTLKVSFQPHGYQVFNYTGSNQVFNVPENVCQLQVKLWGAGGGAGSMHSVSRKGGAGGYAEGDLAVSPEEELEIVVGGKGLTKGFGYLGGFGGGGNAGQNDGGSGGGRSAIRRASTELVTAAGGGGGGHNCANSNHANGGPGGGLVGGDGGSQINNEGGKGGTQTAGGAAGGGTNGVGNPGSAFQGGNGNQTVSVTGWGGGGGGGYYGGGGSGTTDCVVGGGGGGSSFLGGVQNGVTAMGTFQVPPNTADPDYVSGIAAGAENALNNAGHGMVIIHW